jgi:hypothetical protein
VARLVSLWKAAKGAMAKSTTNTTNFQQKSKEKAHRTLSILATKKCKKLGKVMYMRKKYCTTKKKKKTAAGAA